MSDEIATLEELVSEATVVLRETEHRLQKLAQLALAQHEQLLTNQQQNGHDSAQAEITLRRLQRIGQQLAQFSEHSKALQIYLQNGLVAPLSYDQHWSRIRVLQSHEEERAQLARDLEDGVGQLLANAVFELASCRHLLESDRQAVSEGLDALQRELEQGLTEVRQSITDLEPTSVLGNFGLGGGIRRYLEQYEARTQIASRLRINTNIGRLPSIIELAIFRVIQEALLNVQRHAQARQVEVTVAEKEGLLEFRVIDDGAGFNPDRVDVSKKNLGLARMVDYAALLNGKLKILSDPGHGTQVILSLPYQAF
jgi:two-component system sensor histidine kinase DegS